MSDPVAGRLTAEERDRFVLGLYEQLLEIEQRLIPTGLHVFGQAPSSRQAADLLRMVASFDRPELCIRSLPGLVAAGLGFPDYPELLRESAASEVRLQQREKVEAVVREAIAVFLGTASGTGGTESAAGYLAREASVSTDAARAVFRLLGSVRRQLSVNGELDALMRALRGEYIEPGPGADIVQNPGILPTGRNTHAVNPYGVPSVSAWQKSETIVDLLLERHLREQGRYPEAIGMVLWGMDNIKTQGEGVAQALRLLGVEPVRDAMNRVSDVAIIPWETLGRPRMDVVMSVSGIFRDLFGATMELLDKAVRCVAALDEPPECNYLRKHVRERLAAGAPIEDAAARVFSNAAGNYGTHVNFLVLESQWNDAREIGDLFMMRKCFAYGRKREGVEARDLLEEALSRVEATYQNIDNTEIGITDVDHYFEYLGGLSQAVEQRARQKPRIYLSDTLAPAAKMRTLEETVRLEVRAKILNPKWYEGMLRHGYRGVAEIENHVANTFGWSATAGAVDGWVYDEIAATFVLEESMLQRLRTLNPHAARNLVGRLLEAQHRGFWQADPAVIERLHDTFAELEDHLEGVGPEAVGAAARDDFEVS